MGISVLIDDEKRPKLSVCVITYNQEKYIRNCLQSIVDQKTDFDFEVIVGDDCSIDHTRVIIQEFAERYPTIVKPIYHEKNIGRGCYNYLSVHHAARGTYIAHLDGDDWCEPDKLANQVAFLDSNPDCVAAVHKLAMCDPAGERLSSTWPKRFRYRKYDLTKLVMLHPEFGHSSLMYRNGALSSVTYYEVPKFIDFYIYVHLASQGKIGSIDKVLGSYTCNVGVSATQNFLDLAIQSLLYAKKVGLSQDVFQFGMARQYLHFAKKAIIQNDDILFKELIILSLKEKYISTQQGVLYLMQNRPTIIKLFVFVYRTLKHGFQSRL